jgi:hypothetical protein
VLDVDGSHDADAAVQQLEDVLIPLLMPAPRDVRVREFIDDTDLRPALQNRVDVHLFQHDTAVRNRTARNDLEIPDLGICVGPPVRPDKTHDEIAALTPRIVRIPQHRIGLSDTWRGPWRRRERDEARTENSREESVKTSLIPEEIFGRRFDRLTGTTCPICRSRVR